MSAPITIVDYGMGNIGSLLNMFRRVGADAEVSAQPAAIAKARKILLPGVGAFDAAMSRIDELGLREPLRARALEDGVPFLGICLGMQLLLDRSEEGEAQGLGLIPGHAVRFPRHETLKVPHMGWNAVEIVKDTPLTSDLPDDPRFYFVHSYHVEARDRADVMLACTYGLRFDAGLNRGNIYGAQFHPEKSHKFGMAMLRGFAGLPC
ncbi:MAG: imidazole glycerol phosphate synthase subunit HisH [Litorimonas sp.]